MSPPPIDRILAERARTHGSRTFLRFATGDLSFAEVDRRATSLAHGLASAGVGRGDVVATLLPNCQDAAVLPFAVARLGAVFAPINTAFRGRVLRHVLDVSTAAVLIADEALVDAVAAVAPELEHLQVVFVRGSAPRAGARSLEVRPFAELHSSDAATVVSSHGPDDLGMLLFTSGTTGRSKACRLAHRFGPRQAELMIEHYGLRPDDVLYCPFPLFHLDALVLTVMPALLLGTAAAIGERFSVSRFWQEVRGFEATVFDFMGATLTMLHKAAPHPEDGANPVRLAWGVPIPDWAPEFEARFGLRLVELYGSTDVGIPIYQPLDEPRVPGSCGRTVEPYELRLVAEDGSEVPPGHPGEIAVRSREPGLITLGYHGMPEASTAALRDGWLYTGDLATRDDAGNVFFVGRRKDAIRRRGENISAFEVEEVALTHPDVLDAAAFGVPSDLSEEEVMIAVVARPGHTVDPAELVAHCAANMGRYMVPRYVDVVETLPRTPTEKVEKYRLAERGITPTTWDREAR